MIAIIKTCEHCGCEYTYYASGYLCTGSDNDEHLCPRCKHAVNEALKAIPVEFEKTWSERPDDFTKEQIADIIESAEAWEKQKAREAEASGWPRAIRVILHNDYETYIEFYKDGKMFDIFYNSKEDYTIRAHVYVKVNHDAKNDFARYVKYDDHQGFEMVCYTKCSHMPKIETVPVKPLAAPVGNLLYTDHLFDNIKQHSRQPINTKLKKRK